MAVGLVVAAHSWNVVVIAVVYLSATLLATVRREEQRLAAKFGEEYESYRTGQADASPRRFSFARAIANGEHRTIAGLITAMALLSLKAM
jgi:hypothetical protein